MPTKELESLDKIAGELRDARVQRRCDYEEKRTAMRATPAVLLDVAKGK